MCLFQSDAGPQFFFHIQVDYDSVLFNQSLKMYANSIHRQGATNHKVQGPDQIFARGKCIALQCENYDTKKVLFCHPDSTLH